MLPKDSLLYSEFMLLNELNPLRLNGNELPVSVKQQLIEDLFKKENRRVTKKRILDYLVMHGYAAKTDEISGIDDPVKTRLRSYHDFAPLIPVLGEEAVEKIIEGTLVYSDDKRMLRRWLKKNFPALNEDDVRKICRLKYADWGRYCKEVSGGLPTMISPYIDGSKNVSQYNASTSKQNVVTLESHEREWDAIFAGIKGAVDIVAFQDGHVEYDELVDFLKVNKKLADRYGLECWTNSETFDRDMPIKFLPIKWEKLRLKMGLAAQAGYQNAITFEFSHFMSPQSAYLQAGHLYDRYMEYLKTLE